VELELQPNATNESANGRSAAFMRARLRRSYSKSKGAPSSPGEFHRGDHDRPSAGMGAGLLAAGWAPRSAVLVSLG
jgi:hypothetical protein